MMTRAWNRVRGNRSLGYTPLPVNEKETYHEFKQRNQERSPFTVLGLVLCIAGCLFALYGLTRYSQVAAHVDMALTHTQLSDLGVAQVLRHYQRRLPLQPKDHPLLGPILSMVFSAV